MQISSTRLFTPATILALAFALAGTSPALSAPDQVAEKAKPTAATKPAKLSPAEREQFVASRMVENGHPHFLLLDKSTATLVAFQNGIPYLRTEVILGKDVKGRNLTPDGVFSLTNTYKGEQKPYLVYHVNNLALLIHGEIAGRETAMASQNPMDRRLSAGCINVPDAMLPLVLNFARYYGQTTMKATPMVILNSRETAIKIEKSVTSFRSADYNPN